MNGTITRVVLKEGKGGGFGFLRDEFDDSRFFHANDLLDGVRLEDLVVGQAVSFAPRLVEARPGSNSNGLRAEKVRVTK